MSFFDDDFYSTKVSKKNATERTTKKRIRWIRSSHYSTNRKTLRLVILTSLSSAIIVTAIFLTIGANIWSNQSQPVTTSTDVSGAAIAATSKVRPAVVSIINEQMFSAGVDPQKIDPELESGVLREAGVGSGVIIEKQADKAYIVTNHHVTADADNVKVVLTTGEVKQARMVGTDIITDLAVLEIDGSNIEFVAELGDSSAVQAAQFVMAMGNPLGMGEAITFGVVSVTREIIPVSLSQNDMYDWEQEVIRVDAAINEGNSGGPLIDFSGKVIGINTMKIADFGVESIGYAIPINNAKPIIASIIKQGYVSRPYLGVSTIDLEHYWRDEFKLQDQQVPEEILHGVIVLEAVGPAMKAGLKNDDIIVKLDQLAIKSTRELRKYLYNKKKIGEMVDVSFYRAGKLKTMSIQLEDKTADDQ
ncbi:S1C family serine protease [Paenibacillus yanchengensis]|uniref:S1C family serine protease n=1 Tax=Paenibacillus yanchengensis TaxID=2035833 RepID=A0ABW4YNY4_9BACL